MPVFLQLTGRTGSRVTLRVMAEEEYSLSATRMRGSEAASKAKATLKSQSVKIFEKATKAIMTTRYLDKERTVV